MTGSDLTCPAQFEGLMDGMGPRNKTLTVVTWAAAWPLVFADVPAGVTGQNLLFTSVLCCFFYHYPWHASPEANIPWRWVRNVENIHTQNIMAITNDFFYTSPSVRTLKSHFSCPRRVLFFWASFQLKGTFCGNFTSICVSALCTDFIDHIKNDDFSFSSSSFKTLFWSLVWFGQGKGLKIKKFQVNKHTFLLAVTFLYNFSWFDKDLEYFFV